MTLQEWTVNYVKSRDAAYNNIESLKEQNNTILVTHKNTSVGSGFKKQTVPKSMAYEVQERLEKKTYADHTTIITYNTEKNIHALLTDFSFFASQPNVKIIFSNPNTHETWQIMPSRHKSMLSMTGADLKTSILALSENTTQC